MNLTDTREIITALKAVYREKNLSIDKVLALVNERVGEGTVSRTTIQNIFAEGSEDGTRKFGYETVLKPLCVAMLDIERIGESDDTDVRAYKSILKLKKDIIDELNLELETEKLNYYEKLQEETEKFQRSMDFLRNQITLKDQRIDDLLLMNKELMLTNNKLVQQLMNCPLKKEC